MFTAGLCWAMGFFISALGVYIHNLWVIYFGLRGLRRTWTRHRLHLAGFDIVGPDAPESVIAVIAKVQVRVPLAVGTVAGIG